MKRQLVSFGILLLLAAQNNAFAHAEPDVSFLSEAARSTLTQIKSLHHQLREKGDDGRELGRSLHEACMVGGPRGPRPEHKSADGSDKGPESGERRPPALTDAQKQEFETKLTSSSCTQAIAAVQSKL